MSDTHLNGAKSNGTNTAEVKTPFLIGVAGGTASGKVIIGKCVLLINITPAIRHFIIKYYLKDFVIQISFHFSRLFVKELWNN